MGMLITAIDEIFNMQRYMRRVNMQVFRGGTQGSDPVQYRHGGRGGEAVQEWAGWEACISKGGVDGRGEGWKGGGHVKSTAVCYSSCAATGRLMAARATSNDTLMEANSQPDDNRGRTLLADTCIHSLLFLQQTLPEATFSTKITYSLIIYKKVSTDKMNYLCILKSRMLNPDVLTYYMQI